MSIVVLVLLVTVMVMVMVLMVIVVVLSVLVVGGDVVMTLKLLVAEVAVRAAVAMMTHNYLEGGRETNHA